jgi:pilus assembly protein CpaD
MTRTLPLTPNVRRRIAKSVGLGMTGLLLVLGACTDLNYAAPAFRTSQTGHENKVERLVWPHAISFKARQDDLDAKQKSELADAIETAGGAEAIHVRIAPPATAKGGVSKQAAAQRERIVLALRKLGVAANRIETDDTTPPLKGTFALSLERYVVTPPACPDWTDPLGQTDARQVASNWGCATNTNLGLMAADPRDLVTGRSFGPEQGSHATNAVDRYRQDKVYAPSQQGTGAKAGGGG